jgi:hypothetical protein
MAYPGCREPLAARGHSHAPGDVLTAPILSEGGWPYASSPPIDAHDPGRFHALFGRDSLITPLAVMPAQPEVARATLRVLATLQGRRNDPETDEEPGKIVHEYRPHAEQRFADLGWPIRDGELRYYGSADSTSWFLVVLATLGDAALTEELSGAWRPAARHRGRCHSLVGSHAVQNRDPLLGVPEPRQRICSESAPITPRGCWQFTPPSETIVVS